MNKENTKTKKRKRRRLNIKRVFILALVICVFVLIFKYASKIKINNIEVEGNDYISASDIIKLSELSTKTYYFKFNSNNVCKKIMTNKLVNTCKIERLFNFKVKISISENKPILYYLYNNKLILSNGSDIDYINSYGVPNLINYVPEETLSKFISGLSKIKSDIIRQVSEIEYSPSANANGAYIDEERFMLEMNDGNIVYVNIKNIDALNNYDKIYASIGDKKGYYNFDTDYDNYYFEEFSNSKE